jgi:hypothetical protein
MHIQRVVVLVTSGDFTASLPDAIFWNRCYLEKTNLKAKGDSADPLVYISIDQVSEPCTIVAGSDSLKQQISFILTDDDFSHPVFQANMITNGDPSFPLSELRIKVREYNSDGVMILRFEKD